MRYWLDFGIANAGGTPAFDTFRRADTGVEATAPTPSVIDADGFSYFDWTWSTSPSTSIVFKASYNGTELADTITDGTLPAASATAAADPGWRFETAQTICNNAAVELGLSSSDPITAPVDVWASTESIWVQLRVLLNACGKELAADPETDWPWLTRDASFTAAAAVAPAIYGANSLVQDFERILPDTWQNATSTGTSIIEASPRTWARALNSVSSGIDALVRIEGDRILLYPTHAAETITYRYQSRYWSKSSGQSYPDKATCSANGDTVYFDPLVITARLKLKYAMAKALDQVPGLLAEWERIHALYAGKHQMAPRLRLDGGSRGIHLLDHCNLPDTGYGA